MDRTIALISLGCAKNLVNSEQMLYLLSEAGYALAPSPDGADAVIINTCGFIDAAKSEAIDTILEMAKLKAEGRLGKIIVTGCLTERYRAAVTDELPEVDAILGVGSFGDIVPAVDAVFEEKPVSLFADNSAPVDEIPRVVSTGRRGHICASPRAAITSAPSARYRTYAADTARERWKTSLRKRATSQLTA